MGSSRLRLHHSALQEGSLVVVTGANGYVGSHIVNTLLQTGFRVRGTVRDLNRSSWMEELFRNRYGLNLFELVQVHDITSSELLKEAFKGASGIIHCAADTSFSDDASGIIKMSVQGVISALDAAKSSAAVERFVFTSSSGALYTPGSDGNEPQMVNKNTWNHQAIAYVESLMKPTSKTVLNPAPGVPDAFLIYSASKALAERALFEWMGRENPKFVANTVIPGMNTGEILSYEHQGFPSSSGIAAGLFQSTSWDEPRAQMLKFMPAQWWIDVEDDARVHVAALVHPYLQNERVFSFHKRCNLNDFLHIFADMCPKRQFPQNIEYGIGGVDPHDAEQEVLKAVRILNDVGFEGFLMDMKSSLKKQLAPIIVD